MKLRYYSMAALLVAAALAAYALAHPSLPARIPTHWNAHGQIDSYGAPATLLVIGPLTMACLAALFALLPWLSPRQFAVEAFEKTYLRIMLVVVAIPAYMFALMLWAALSPGVDVLKALIAGSCVFFVLIGNVLGKVRRNFFIGIRTPWTLASEQTWYATHRFAGKTIVAASALAAVLVLAGASAWAVIALIAAGFLLPVVYSLVYFKRLEREGHPDASR